MSSVITHDSCHCASSFVKDNNPKVFENGCTVQEMAELSSSCVSLDANPAFYPRLEALLQQQKQNMNVSKDLHKLLLCSIYPIHIQRTIQFILPDSCLPNVNSLLDIGYIVRRLLLKWHSFSCMQYSNINIRK